MKTRVLLIAIAVLFVGCAGLRPAVRNEAVPVLTPSPESVETAGDPTTTESTESTVLPGADEQLGTGTAETATKAAVAAPHQPQPVDTLALPDEAFPPAPGAFKESELLPSDGPDDEGVAPPALEDGWKVQLASYVEKQQVNAVHAELKQRLAGIPVHLRYDDGSYILLAGNFIQRESADSLRDVLMADGFPDAFVVEVSVVASDSAVTDAVDEGLTAEQADSEAAAVEWRIQVISVSDVAMARQQARTAGTKSGLTAVVVTVNGTYKVQLGGFSDEAQAREARDRLVGLGYEGAFLVRVEGNAGGK